MKEGNVAETLSSLGITFILPQLMLNQTRMRVEQVMDSMQRTALQFENASLLKSVMNSW